MPLDFRNKLDYLKWYAQIRHIKRRAVDLFEQAIEIARRYNEPLLAIEDDLSNVWQDSAGTLPATVGSPIGLLTDRAFGGELGVELVTGGGFDSATGWTVPVGASITAGALVLDGATSLAGGAIITTNIPSLSLTANKTYVIEYEILTPITGAGGISVGASTGGTLGTVHTTPGVKSEVLTPTSNASIAVFCRGGTGTRTGSISNISVRELKGNHATQSTAGNRPVLAQVPKRTKGPVNLLTWSANFSDASWNKTGTIVSGSKLISSSGASIRRVSQPKDFVSGTTYTAAVVVQKAEWNYAYLNGPESAFTTRGDVFLNLTSGVIEVNTGNAATVVNLGNGRYLLAYSRTATANISESFRYGFSDTANISSNGDGVSGIFLHSAALFQGTFTAQQIIDNGGIPVTQSTPLPNVLEWTNAASFNGTTNSLQLATNPIGPNLSQPYTIIVAGVVGAIAGGRRVCGDLARRLSISGSGFPSVGHGAKLASATSAVVSVGQPIVFEAQWDGSTLTMWLNSAIVFSEPFAAPSGVTPGAFFVGQNGSNSDFWNGQLTAVTAFDRVLTDSERTTIGKAFARELGVTYG
jgi:hypothetical protein